MILDALLAFSQNQSLAQAVGSYDSTNILDFGINGIPGSGAGGGARDLSVGDDPSLKLLVQLTSGVTSGGAGTVSATLSSAVDNGSGAPGAFVPWYTSPVYALAALKTGARLLDMDLPRPPQGVAIPRYLKLTYNVAGATLTAGTISSFIVLDRNDQMYNGLDNTIPGGYPPGIAINN